MKSYAIVGFVLFVCLTTSHAQLPESPGRRAECSPPFRVAKGRGALQARATSDDDKKYVRFVYLVPADKQEKPEYRLAIENAAKHLQAWYRSQLGNGTSFNLREPVVEVYHTTHDEIWYSTNPDTDWAGDWKYWFNVVNDAFTLTGGSFEDPNNSWIIYIDAEAVCPLLQGGALNHVAAMGADDLKGLAGEPPRQQCNGATLNYPPCRFVGGLGHELGHTLGLPHPPGCDDQQPVPCDSKSLMYLGYISYPNTYFSEQEKATLTSSGFMDPVDELNCVIDCANLDSYYFVTAARDVSICEGSEFYAGGEWQKEPGTYYDTLTNHPGCDSLIVTNLAVLETTSTEVDVSICEGDRHYAGGAYQTVEGIYYDTLSSVTDCDSVVVTNLKVFEHISTAVDVSIHEGESYYAGGAYQTVEGIYYDTLSSVAGCDSVVVTHLEVLKVIKSAIDVSICEGESYFAGGSEQTVGGTYYDTLITATGRDSVIVTRLNVRPAGSSMVDATICEGDVYLAGGGLQTEGGTYYDTLQTIHGCDSVVVTNLVISVCTAVDEDIETSLIVYPIPADNMIYVGGQALERLELVNPIGQCVRQTNLNYIDCSGLQNGSYYVRVYYGGNHIVTRKVILQR